MADDPHYQSGGDSATKRKYEDSTTTAAPPPSSARRVTGFLSPDSAPSYNSVPPPMDEIQIAKQKAQEIAARLFNNAEAKRPKFENGAGGGGGFDSNDNRDYSSDIGQKPMSNTASSMPSSYGYGNPSKKIEIPNGRVGVIIGKAGETIKYLQLQSGAKIQVTRDMDADPHSLTREVELTGSAESIAKAEQLIKDVLAEAESGGSGIVSRRVSGPPGGAEQFVMQVPNNKVGLVIGKGGETIKNMQASTGARIQVIPLHLPPGDTSTERTVQIDGTSDQIEAAKQMVNEVISEKISESQKASLECAFTEKEVKEAVWSCGSNKAPGPDGFTFEFIRKFWSIVGKDFFDAVKFFESNCCINPGSNSSFITLVPKVKDLLSLADYRPINLIGCVTKVISKVLAERLKGVLDTVVSKNQTAFVKGRNILDGPLLVNEVIHWAKRIKKKLLIFKVDFAKAFDSLNWSFLDSVLNQMGFGKKWRDWVKGCVGTAKMSVLINGSPTNEFRMGKGVRQGDPLAPFLFILAAEGLNVALREATRKNIFRGVCMGNEGEDVSLLQFADDAIFMGEWDTENARNLIRILKCFEVCSGLKVNMSKSRITGVEVSKEDIARMARKLRCKDDSIPFTFLGLPVGGNMNFARNWQPVIDKFKKKLSIWKAKTLSIGGRMQLCKSVLGSLGLGIGSLRAANLAMLAKWWWRDRVEPDAKWKKVVDFCHGSQSRTALSSSSRGTWSSIQGIDKDLRQMGINILSMMHRKEDTDDWEWDLESNKIFTVRSLRKWIDAVNLPISNFQTDWVSWLPSKVNIHLWRVSLNRLATRDNLLKRGVVLSSDECPFCLTTAEGLEHLFVNCSTTKIVSAHLKEWLAWWPDNISSVSDFWSVVSSDTRNPISLQVYKVIIAAFLWTIWTNRNGVTFNGSLKKEKEMCREVQFLAFDWIRCRAKFGKLLIWRVGLVIR
ncbi:hypothetical protein OSB04_030130 [Centaurea solstitialis]|uniref:Reverse transcriptase domain-containing protein n=1 Tax=Centaurea solstitialis TaxID=347529 RepID=A0AA38VSY2_9ASTR|nr:hypothetical protein OSB04_030130 [Centaurea solstitialis]